MSIDLFKPNKSYFYTHTIPCIGVSCCLQKVKVIAKCLQTRKFLKTKKVLTVLVFIKLFTKVFVWEIIISRMFVKHRSGHIQSETYGIDTKQYTTHLPHVLETQNL